MKHRVSFIIFLSFLSLFLVSCKDNKGNKTTIDNHENDITVKVESCKLNINNNDYYLYGQEEVDFSEFKLTMCNLDKWYEWDVELTKNGDYVIDVEDGKYEFSYEYNGYKYLKIMDINENNRNVTLDLSQAYLGGSIDIKNSLGNDLHIKSYGAQEDTQTSGSNWELIDGSRNNIKLTSNAFALQNEVVTNKVYVEGTFSNTNRYYNNINMCTAGLLLAHGPADINKQSAQTNKLIFGINGKAVYANETGGTFGDNGAQNVAIICNLEGLKDESGNLIVSDYSNVKLGVCRNVDWYYIYINDKYVGSYYYPTLTNESGIGVCACNPLNVSIKDFNYSVNEELINALTKEKLNKKPIDVYIIAGQSNAQGHTTFTESTMLKANQHYVYGFNNIHYIGSCGAGYNNKVSFGLVRTGLGGMTNRMGAEIGLAEGLSSIYNTETGKECVIIRYAVGGTKLLDNSGDSHSGSKADGNWASPSYVSWHGGPKGGTYTGGLYRKFLKEFTEDFAFIKEMGYEPTVKGFYWAQGEDDRTLPNEYNDAFQFFVCDMRNELTTITGVDQSNLPFIMAEISRTYVSGLDSSMDINKAFNDMVDSFVNKIDNLYILRNSKYDLSYVGTQTKVSGSDGYHYCYQDHLRIGKNLSEWVKAILFNETVSDTSLWLARTE